MFATFCCCSSILRFLISLTTNDPKININIELTKPFSAPILLCLAFAVTKFGAQQQSTNVGVFEVKTSILWAIFSAL